MEMSVASEPLNFFIILIYMIQDLLMVFSFLPFGNGRIDHFTDLLHDLLNRCLFV